MTETTIGRLRVDGAELYHEVRGRGPLLLLIPGGTGGAASFEEIVDDLAADRTVVTYDPRGLSNSPLDDPAARQRVEQHAEDALRLIDLLSPGEPVSVVGCSSGAIVAMHLLTAHPGRVARVVAHEPPLAEVLPDAAEHRAMLARVREAFDREGLMAAATVLAAGLRRPGETADARPAAEPSPRAAARVERSMADAPYFIGRIIPSFMAHVPDVDRLRALSDRLVLAAGADSRGELPYRPAAFLAERFGTELVHFPGGHTGLSTHPAEFGKLLREVLDAR
ncbi:alpha/beta fold hydrolase [Streptosporangium sp. NPDC001559]|uniref:alpha/beta fold hydrolase n=1 Tax=Streptosporangium sp. NPDC001559 TaxID=3366187 RepID=UPI0036E066E8